MNTIEEIIKNKRRRTLTEETIFETYKRVLCKNCTNRKNNEDLCKITVTLDRKARCYSYEKCMKNSCKTCKNKSKCFEKEK